MRAQLELGSYGDGRPDVPPASPLASPPAFPPASPPASPPTSAGVLTAAQHGENLAALKGLQTDRV